jgi:hypothetical protein
MKVENGAEGLQAAAEIANGSPALVPDLPSHPGSERDADASH